MQQWDFVGSQFPDQGCSGWKHWILTTRPPGNSNTWRFLIRSLLFCCRRLAGCTVFITGASRGIGKAIALKAAKDGANVVIAAKTTQTHPKLQGTIYTAAEESEFQCIENLLEYLFAFLLFSPSFLLSFPLLHMEFLGQGSDLIHSWNLGSCGNPWFFHPLCWAGDGTCILALQR